MRLHHLPLRSSHSSCEQRQVPEAAPQFIANIGPAVGSVPKLARKVVVLAGIDDFVSSRSGALIPLLTDLARDIVVVAPASMRDELESRGARVIVFDPRTAATSTTRGALAAWRLARILEAENADLVHAVGVRSAVLCGLALKLIGAGRAIVHLPDLEALEPAHWLPTFYNRSPAKVIAMLVSRPSSFLLVERTSDLADLRAKGIDAGPRVAVVGGPGIDPDAFPLLPPAHGDMPVAACIAPMRAGGGVDTVMQAFDQAWSRGVRLRLELAGPCIEGCRGEETEIAHWALHPGVVCTEPVGDVRELWRRAEICVLPALTPQAFPRSLLEAAACGRALIVTHCANGASFVRHEVEGLVVPPGDVSALSAALERLARDADLRWRLGHAARVRALHGFTEAHVQETVKGAYMALLDECRPE